MFQLIEVPFFMDAKLVQKYAKYSVPQLRLKASKKFRAWVRKRDEGQPCISCGSYNVSDAGHYYSAGNFPAIEMEPDNCHLQCRKCNYFLSGNLLEYRKGLIERIGLERVEGLDMLADAYKREGYKHQRFSLIEKIEQYK